VNNVNDAAPFLEPDTSKASSASPTPCVPGACGLAISVDIASPQKIGGLKTFDPLDPAVKAWWAAKVKRDLRRFPTSPDSR
jgi:alpha-glucuronidase